MEQEQRKEEEGISIVDIFKLFLRKIKIILLALLCGCLLGTVIALFKTVNVRYFGTRVEFYVTPRTSQDLAEEEDKKFNVYGAYGRSAMDNMVELLLSESFIEKVILNGETLPKKDSWVDGNNAAEVALDLNGKIDAAQEKVDVLNADKAQLRALRNERAKKSDELAKKKTTLDERWLALTYTNLPGSTDAIVKNTSFNEYEYTVKVASVTETSNPELYLIVKDVQSAYGEWDAVRDEIEGKDAEIESKTQEIAEKTTEKDAVVEVALEAWRKTKLYQETLEDYSEALSFSYMETEGTSSSTVQSFIYVDISVLNDNALANEIYEKVKTVVPNFVRNNMLVPSGDDYIGSYCERVTRMDEVERTNPDDMRNEIIKYGLLIGAITLVAACVVVFLMEQWRKQKEKRSEESIAEQETPRENNE